MIMVLQDERLAVGWTKRLEVFNARFAEAMASVSSGEAFVVVKNFDGDYGGQGAYSNPNPADVQPNAWLLYEFPTLQRNPAITKITSVDINNNYNQHIDWQASGNNPSLPAGFTFANTIILPASDASSQQPPPPGYCNAKRKRQDDVCATCVVLDTPGESTGIISVSGTGFHPNVTGPVSATTQSQPTTQPPSSTQPGTTTQPGATTEVPSTTQAASITPGPSISCSLQNKDPGAGINTPYCSCSSSKFFVLSVGTTATGPEASCAYTSLDPASTIQVSNALPVTTSNCQVCTIAPDSEQCTPLPNCTPTNTGLPILTAAATPSTVVQVSNNSVHVGDLSGSNLYSSMWSAVQPNCPEATNGPVQCGNSGATISNIGTVVGSESTEGELTFTIEDSSYTTTGQRDAMLGAAIQAFQNSATGGNCGSVPYSADSESSCSSKRDLEGREVGPTGHECTEHLTVCNAANLISEFSLPHRNGKSETRKLISLL